MKRIVADVMVCVAILVIVWAGGAAQASNGVPVVSPGYGQDVESWWAEHPLNPEGPYYDPNITSPSPQLNVQTQFSSDVQAAIDYVETNHPGGATLYFPAGTYLAPFDVVGVDNLHFLGDSGGGTIISTNVDQPAERGWGKDYSYITLLSCPEAHDYGVYNLCMHDGTCTDCVLNENKLHNIYFKNMTFDGNNHSWWGAFYCSSIKDVIWENCTYQNFVSPAEHHPGQINANCRCNNMWAISCEFAGDNCWATYWDGPHGSGLISCLNSGNWNSGNHLMLTNDDFSEDTNNNGVWDDEEVRNPRYIVFYNNTLNDNYTAFDINQAGDILIKNNVAANGLQTFIYSTDRCSNRWTDLEYVGFYNRIIGNTVPSAGDSFYEVDSRHECDGTQTNYGQLGNYHVYCNTVGNNPTNGLVYEHGALIYDDDIDIVGNCVNDPGCTPANCNDSTVYIPVFSPPGGSYAAAQSVTISSGTSGADVYYTTDGSEPSQGGGTSTLYTGAISVSTTTTLKAKGFKAGLNDSPTNSQEYVIDTILPSAPTGLSSTGHTASSVSLAWTAGTDNDDVGGYTIYRDGTAVGTAGGTSYVDSGLIPSTPYSYQVSTFDLAGNDSAMSNQVVVTTDAYVPEAWNCVDVGSVGVAGSCDDQYGTMTLEGSGADIWNAADAFHFMALPFTGDGEVIARVVSVENTNSWAKAGVMLRDSLNADAVHCSVFQTPSNGVSAQRRETTGGASASAAGSSSSAPRWLRLQRSGTSVSCYESADGGSWDLISTHTMSSLGSSIYAGIVVCSHNNTTLCTAVFDNITVTSGPTETESPSDPTNLAVTGTTDATVALSWTASTDNVAVAGYRVLRDTVQVGTTASTSYTNTGLSPCSEYSYTVRAFDPSGNVSGDSNMVTATTQAGIQDADFTDDGTVDMADLAAMAGEWLTTGTPGCPIGDLNSDGAVDMTDFSMLVPHWGEVELNNLIENPSFADGLDIWGTPAGSAAANGSIDTTFGRTDSASFQAIGGTGDAYLDQTPTLTASTAYQLSCWIKPDAVSGGITRCRYVQLNPSTVIYNGNTVDGTADWTQSVADFTTASDYAGGRADLLWDHDTGTAWFDDVSLVEN